MKSISVGLFTAFPLLWMNPCRCCGFIWCNFSQTSMKNPFAEEMVVVVHSICYLES